MRIQFMVGLMSILLATSVSYGARSVSISVPNGKLQLTNGSATTVSYSIECFDKVSGTKLIDLTSQTLGSNKEKVVSAEIGCAADATVYKTFSEGPLMCQKSVTYANRNQACGGDSQACTFSKIRTLGMTNATYGAYGYWMTPDSATTWYRSYDASWSKSNTYDMTSGKAWAPATSSKTSDGYCNSTNSATNAIRNCTTVDVASNGNGTLCCPNNNGFASCKVTISSAEGYLQSPQYKGGAPF